MTFDELYQKLEKFVHYLAHSKANGAALMDHDEISGELFEEMVKGYARYSHLPEGQLLAVIRRMMDNRISELIYKYYKTHRGLAIGSDSFPDDDQDTVDTVCNWMNSVTWSSNGDCQDVSALVESRDRVRETFDRLSAGSKKVLRAVLDGNRGLLDQIYLSGLRSSYVYQANGKIKVRPWQVADSLAIDESDVRKAYREIKRVYAEVSDGV